MIVEHVKSSATGVASETAHNSESGTGDDGEKRDKSNRKLSQL